MESQMVSNQVDALTFIQSFLKIPRVWHETLWFGKSLHDKTKQTTLLHRWIENYFGKARFNLISIAHNYN
jgi:hypothetical protein